MPFRPAFERPIIKDAIRIKIQCVTEYVDKKSMLKISVILPENMKTDEPMCRFAN
jgi:hypothetical protein